MSILGKFFKSGDDDSKVPPPGTPPTYDEHGVLIDSGNPFIGPINPKLGYATEGYSQAQLRTIRRAGERRAAAELRVNSRKYARSQEARQRYESFAERRRQILLGNIAVPAAAFRNAMNDNVHRHGVTKAFDTLAERSHAKSEAREDRLDERRIARFKAGKPRGKDLREETFKQYSSFLPRGYFLGQPREGQFFSALNENGTTK